MIDREKVVKGLECCIANMHNNCPYKSTDEGIDKVTSCTTYLMKDALALLKEQKSEEKRILKIVWDILHSGVSTDTEADQDWVYEQIRNQVHQVY